jgi:hypothetical protein
MISEQMDANEFWKILCDENHPDHLDAMILFAQVLSKPLHSKVRGLQSNAVIWDDVQDE